MDSIASRKDRCPERSLGPRSTRELKTMRAMLRLYCKSQHGAKGSLCGECAELAECVRVRLTRCPHGEGKPTCANCPIHCYTPALRERVRAIMRFSGPRMLLFHPILALLHQLDGRRKPRALRGRSPST